MLISKCWAVCKANAYASFNTASKPLVYLSDELCDSLVFFKPNLCDIIIKNQKYEFYVLPRNEEPDKKDIFYNEHVVSIPSTIYHRLIGFKDNQFLSIRTDLF
ncbi:MAG: hypothetical protein WC393_00925 [Candidatus Nanoarchaeia archaeon]|jgi:hypothetical protein